MLEYKYSNILKPSHSSYLSAYVDGTECSETSAYKIQTPGNYPEERIQKIATLIYSTSLALYRTTWLQQTSAMQFYRASTVLAYILASSTFF